jgi:hypothetical protein
MKPLISQISPGFCYIIPLRSIILLSALFSNTLRLCSSNNLRGKFSCPYITTDNLINLCISASTFPCRRKGDKQFWNELYQMFLEFYRQFISSYFDMLIRLLVIKWHFLKFEILYCALPPCWTRTTIGGIREVSLSTRKHSRTAFCPDCTVSFTTKCTWIIERTDSSQSVCLRCDQISNQNKVRWMDTCHGSLLCRNSDRFLPAIIW